MLIRVSGATSGIAEYLVHGQKQGRDMPRDALDERVILDGDLELTDAIIQGMGKEGERYLHITISFKEDSIDPDVLRNIASDFKRFAMVAYEADEYNFYAEAHLPKIKSYADKRTGASIERKPHVHIVIPQLNLLSEQNLNPFGKVDQQVKFLEAFQEHANAKYGLASPKENRRLEFAGHGDMISRYKGDLFEGNAKALKGWILADVLNRKIGDYDAFKALLSEHGLIRTRNAGAENEYQNVKPVGQAKGVNLKDYVFSREFIAKSEVEKQQFLERQGSRTYDESQASRDTGLEMAARLHEWSEIRAKEVKYINSGSRKVYDIYRKSDRDGKLAILAERAQRFYAKYQMNREVGSEFSQSLEEDQSVPEFLPSKEFERVREQAVGKSATGLDVAFESGQRRDSDSVVGQLTADHKERITGAKAAQLAEFAHIKRELDGRRLLAHLSRTHGVIPDKYEVTQGKDGGDRIRAGARHLNVSDFLTQEMRLSFAEAAPILREVFAAQQSKEVSQAKPEPRRELWETFHQAQPDPAQRRALKTQEWDAQRQSERERRMAIRESFQAERRAIQNDPDRSGVECKAAMSIARMQRVTQDMALRAAAAEERQLLKDRQRQPYQAHYRAFLADLAGQGDTLALAELWRQRDAAPAPCGPSISQGRERGLDEKDEAEKDEASYLERSLAYSIDHAGDVTYYADRTRRQALLVDSGQRVTFIDIKDRQVVEAGLRLALQKFGLSLKIEGDDEFRQQLIDAAFRTGLQVEFDSPAMNNELSRRRAEQNEVQARGRAFIDSEREKEARAQLQPASRSIHQQAQEKAPQPAPERQSQPEVEPKKDRGYER
ncbi:MAG: hypothetical protein EON56_00625 [Alphaproteobacteria bacterium]|nr:MAG: hypothetical protein EON56_00625 [Alphaproteobacteria bacterium]